MADLGLEVGDALVLLLQGCLGDQHLLRPSELLLAPVGPSAPGGVPVLDLKHKDRALAAAGKQLAVVRAEGQLGDRAGAAMQLLERSSLPQRQLVGPDGAPAGRCKQQAPSCGACLPVATMLVRLEDPCCSSFLQRDLTSNPPG